MRSTASMVFMILLALSSSTLIPAAADARPACTKRIAFEEIFDRGFGAVTLAPGDRVIRSQEDWCAFWDDLHRRFFPAPPCDTGLIDFSEEVVLATIGAMFSSGCWDVEIVRVERLAGPPHDRALLVDVRETAPGPGCLCTDAFQTPVQAVVVPGTVRRVYFAHHQATLNCERR